MVNRCNTNSIYKKTFSSLLAIYPFLSVYATPGIVQLGLHEFVMIAFLMFYVLSKWKKPIFKAYRNSFFEFFFVYSLVISLVMAFFIPKANFGDVIFRALRNSLQWVIVFFVAKDLFDFSSFYKIYRIFATMLSAFLIIQNVAFMSAGIVVPWLIPGLKLNYVISEPTEYMPYYIGKQYYAGVSIRATGGFAEPAAFTAYVLPLLALTLIMLSSSQKAKDKRKYYFTVIVVSAAVYLATSAIGILCMASIYVVFLGKWALKKGSKMKALAVPLAILLVLLAAGYLISTNEMIQNYILRFQEIDLSAGASSGNQRVLRGMFVFLELPNVMKILGTGFGNISATLISFNIHTPYDPEFGSNYMNGISEVLVSVGVIGFISFVLGFFECIRKDWFLKLEIITVFVCYMVSSNMLASASFVVYIVLVIFWKREGVVVNGKPKR